MKKFWAFLRTPAGTASLAVIGAVCVETTNQVHTGGTLPDWRSLAVVLVSAIAHSNAKPRA